MRAKTFESTKNTSPTIDSNTHFHFQRRRPSEARLPKTFQVKSPHATKPKYFSFFQIPVVFSFNSSSHERTSTNKNIIYLHLTKNAIGTLKVTGRKNTHHAKGFHTSTVRVEPEWVNTNHKMLWGYPQTPLI